MEEENPEGGEKIPKGGRESRGGKKSRRGEENPGDVENPPTEGIPNSIWCGICAMPFTNRMAKTASSILCSGEVLSLPAWAQWAYINVDKACMYSKRKRVLSTHNLSGPGHWPKWVGPEKGCCLLRSEREFWRCHVIYFGP